MKLEMNDDIRTEWVKALRSGKYPQAKNYLRSDEGFCCLGVLCELAREAGVVQEYEFDEDDRIYGYDGGWSLLPESVMEWAGLEQELPWVGDSSLSTLNDGGSSFDEIADLIEGVRNEA